MNYMGALVLVLSFHSSRGRVIRNNELSITHIYVGAGGGGLGG